MNKKKDKSGLVLVSDNWRIGEDLQHVTEEGLIESFPSGSHQFEVEGLIVSIKDGKITGFAAPRIGKSFDEAKKDLNVKASKQNDSMIKLRQLLDARALKTKTNRIEQLLKNKK